SQDVDVVRPDLPMPRVDDALDSVHGFGCREVGLGQKDLAGLYVRSHLLAAAGVVDLDLALLSRGLDGIHRSEREVRVVAGDDGELRMRRERIARRVVG